MCKSSTCPSPRSISPAQTHILDEWTRTGPKRRRQALKFTQGLVAGCDLSVVWHPSPTGYFLISLLPAVMDFLVFTFLRLLSLVPPQGLCTSIPLLGKFFPRICEVCSLSAHVLCLKEQPSPSITWPYTTWFFSSTACRVFTAIVSDLYLPHRPKCLIPGTLLHL